jgi:hypothetical protein
VAGLANKKRYISSGTLSQYTRESGLQVVGADFTEANLPMYEGIVSIGGDDEEMSLVIDGRFTNSPFLSTLIARSGMRSGRCGRSIYPGEIAKPSS